MSIDLTLFPLKKPEDLQKSSVLCVDRLRFDTDYEVFLQLKGFDGVTKPTIHANPIPSTLRIQMYEDDGIRERRDDRYGTEITFVYAEDLKWLNVSNSTPHNKAISSFIWMLPNNTPILLFWE